MPWLADLVQSSEGSLDVLPVQCLCEFLLHDAADDSLLVDDEEDGGSKEQKAKKRQVPVFVSSDHRRMLSELIRVQNIMYRLILIYYSFLIETAKAKAAAWTAPGSSVGSYS